MYLYGSFLTRLGDTVTVHILTENSRVQQIEIGNENDGVFFTDNPVEIESCVNDTFDHLLRNQATIRLLTRDFIKDLFCTSCMDAVVNIFKGDKCIFAGFIEPQTYSQGYNEVYDELEISCIDVLSALQYSKYRSVGSLGVIYNTIKANAEVRTFADIINEILKKACTNIDITSAGGIQCFYDGSKALTISSGRYDIFKQIAISELLFLGDSEDDVWYQDKVLTSMFKYLNLHILQEGLQFYIFSWESLTDFAAISWQELFTRASKTTSKHILIFSDSDVDSTDTTISIGEVYNQIRLTCNVESVESVIESPLDDDSLVSPYSNRQKYMTELSAEGIGGDSRHAFFCMCHDSSTDYDKSVITDWYLQVKNNPNWIFPEVGTGANLIDKYCQNNTNQQALPNRFPQTPCAAIVSLGKVEHKNDQKDNSPVAKIDMTDYLAISVNGNGLDDEQKAFPTSDSLRDSSPLAVYCGGHTGAVFSPNDSDATNYIVFSGSIILNPIMDFSNNYKALHDNTVWPGITIMEIAKPVPSRTSSDGRFYTQKYYKANTPFDTPIWDEGTDRGLVPFTDTGPQQYEFKYSAAGDGTDKISKIAVLACMLIIGDKCVVETGNDGQISDFEWRKYKTREQCADDDEYYQQSFTIGFDPKIGDKLIGSEFSLQNNIDYTVGIDAEGIAIPIRQSDKLSGQVRFEILGPVNSMWGEITRRHKTWFRREKWYEDSIPLMAHVSNIFLKSFEVKIYSNNGLINNADNSDLIYVSDTVESFVNCKDDIEFEINSALTRTECQQLGVADSIKLSTPIDLTTGHGLLTIFDHNKFKRAKPEQLYVDSYYSEYHKPRILMTQKFIDQSERAELFNLYIHPAMPERLFYIQGISRNLIEGYAELTIKEVWND